MSRLLRSVWALVLTILLGVAVLTRNAAGQTQGAGKPVTNDDVVAMVKAGLSEAVIITTIKNSKHDFETGASALISLKQAGVSDPVIEAIVQSLEKKPSAETPGRDASSLPSAYGFYILDGTALTELRVRAVVTTFGLTLADRGFAVDGLQDQQTLKINSRTPTVIVYQQSAAANNLRLSLMSFTRSMQAYQFNIINTAPQFFSGLYKKSPTETIPIDLWRPGRNVEMRVEPVVGKPGMHRLTPSMPLDVGRYALYFPDSLHGGDIVFSASQGRQASAFEFEVGVTQTSATSSGNVTSRPFVLVANDSDDEAQVSFDDQTKVYTLPGKKALTFRPLGFEVGSTHSLKVTFGRRQRAKAFTVTSPGLQLHITGRAVRVFPCDPNPAKGCSLLE